VTRIDGRPIGDGKPGPITQLVGDWYTEVVLAG
jgi:branched-chain amino acid aminotransferase